MHISRFSRESIISQQRGRENTPDYLALTYNLLSIRKAPACLFAGALAILRGGCYWLVSGRIRQVLKEVLEVLERIQAIGFVSLDDTVDGGTGFVLFIYR